MPPEFRPLVEEKARLLQGYCRELEELIASYKGSSLERRALERLAQLIIECVSDLGFTLAKALNWPSSGSAREVIEAAKNEGWFPKDAAEGFERRYVSMRNRIVHDYEKLDSARLRAEAPGLLAASLAIVENVLKKCD